MILEFCKKRFIKNIIYEAISVFIFVSFISLCAYIRDGINIWNEFPFVIIISVFVIYSCIYPILVMRNYYLHDKNVILTISQDEITYSNKDINLTFKKADIEKVFRIRGHGVGMIPFYYEIYFQDNKRIRISYFMVDKLDKYLNRSIPVIRDWNIFIAKLTTDDFS